MNQIKTETQQRLMLAIGEWFSNQFINPNPHDDNPAEPWSPYIRKALLEVQNSSRANPFVNQSAEISNWTQFPFAYLNPQPLPPRYVFILSLTSQIIEKTQFFMDIGKMQEDGEKKAIIIVSGLTKDYLDALCRIPSIIKLVFNPNVPEPVPYPNWNQELLFAALQFQQAANYSSNKALQKIYNNAADKLINTGLVRIRTRTSSGSSRD